MLFLWRLLADGRKSQYSVKMLKWKWFLWKSWMQESQQEILIWDLAYAQQPRSCSTFSKQYLWIISRFFFSIPYISDRVHVILDQPSGWNHRHRRPPVAGHYHVYLRAFLYNTSICFRTFLPDQYSLGMLQSFLLENFTS